MSSTSSLSSDYQQDLLHSILVVDSHLKEVNTMLHQLRQNFDNYIDSLNEDGRGKAIKLADLIEDIGQKCRDVQDTLHESQEVMSCPLGSEYRHMITVNASSSGKAIMEEYKGLKVKFDLAVAELRKVKNDLKDTYNSYDSLRHEDMKLKEKVNFMEGMYKQQIVDLIARVDGLTVKVVNVQSGSTKVVPAASPLPDSSADVAREIEQQLSELEGRISVLEQQAAGFQQSSVSPAAPPPGPSGMLVKLEDIKTQLEDTNSKLKHLSQSYPAVTSASVLQAKVNSCKERIGSLTVSVKSPGSSQGLGPANSSEEIVAAANAGVGSCLREIRERVLEIGEQLDSLEEDDEDSDSEDEEEQTTVDDIRGKLAKLTEYIEQHSKLTTSDWTLLRLMSLQKSNIQASGTSKELQQSDSSTEDDKLKMYTDRLSLEAVLLSEMANILQTKDYLQPDDTVCREIDSLNSQLLVLHQRLDNEIKTMHFEDHQADLLSSYTELMAEKILVNGHLCSSTFDKKSHMASDSAPSLQPMLLATEALVRSQIDSYISSNMDKTADEILTLPTHLTARTIVQGELTYSLSQLKSRLQQNPEVLKPGPVNYQFMFSRLLSREKVVLDTLRCYSSQIIHSLAVIIFKESEEMTIVEGPETVLEAMCSELSTIIEKHIQHFKEKCRSAFNTHSARKFDIIVNELRVSRETVLSEIKSKHEAYSKDPTSIRDSSLDIPVQSLDSTINNFGEIIALKSIVIGTTNFLAEILKMGSAVLSDIELDQDSCSEDGACLEKGLTSFINALSEALETEALSKANLAKKVTCDSQRSDTVEEQPSGNVEDILRVPDLSVYTGHLSGRAEVIVREAVLNAQLTFSLFKQKLLHDSEINRLRARRPVRTRPELSAEESRDSDDTLDLQDDFQVTFTITFAKYQLFGVFFFILTLVCKLLVSC